MSSILGGNITNAVIASPAITTPAITGTATIDTFAISHAGRSIVEARTSDPASPAIGQMWLRTDL